MGATIEIQRQQQIEHIEQQMAWAQLQPRQRQVSVLSNHGNNSTTIFCLLHVLGILVYQ
jgi:hypothetical protein